MNDLNVFKMTLKQHKMKQLVVERNKVQVELPRSRRETALLSVSAAVSLTVTTVALLLICEVVGTSLYSNNADPHSDCCIQNNNVVLIQSVNDKISLSSGLASL